MKIIYVDEIRERSVPKSRTYTVLEDRKIKEKIKKIRY